MTNLCTSKGIIIPNYIVNNENLKPIDKYIYSYILYFGKMQSYNKNEVEFYSTIYELANNIGVDSRAIKSTLKRLLENNLILIKDNNIKYGVTIKPLYNDKIIDMERVKAEQKINIQKALKKQKQQKKLEEKKKAELKEPDALDKFIAKVRNNIKN